ncbi:MAG: hypothetical protein APR53_09805 [Methanoculleus sp. SDB]|nr:MAG: hypothetical protein APR53_09805 [Methanoculleus sp. SDB]
MIPGRYVLYVCLVLVGALLACGCASAPGEVVTGTVVHVDIEGGFYGIIGVDGTKYLPLNLDPAFAVDGMRVRFTYVPEDLATIQMWGAPITVTWIEEAAGEGAPESLSDGTWELASLRNATGTEIRVLAGTRITAEFGEDGSMAGSGGCNHYGTEYAAGGEGLSGDLSLGPVYATEMYCISPEGVMEQESIYLGMLSSVRTFRIEGGILRLSDGDGRILLIFLKV